MLYTNYMRKFLAIFICKILRILGKVFKRGSSLPGGIALKIDSTILSKITLPKYVIAVSGSNGKTSTVEMIEHVLSSAGLKVAYNYEGSNQIEGITTLILNDCDFNGVCRSDVILMEVDERYARHSFRHIIPTHFVITNLYRDQLTRNGNPEIIFNCLKEAVNEKTRLILNADDPLVSMLDNNNSCFFSIDKYTKENYIGVYDDGVYCPKCKSKFKYLYRHFGSIGNYYCKKCGYTHPDFNYHINEVNLKDGYLIIDDKHRINLAFKSIYNAYNILATYSLCKEINIDTDVIVNSLNDYIVKNGRVQLFKYYDNEGMFLISKHENSTSYNQSLRYIRDSKKECSVVIMVDQISRKYFTSETSWLWDIDFDLLDVPHVKSIIITGLYASDVAVRCNYCFVDKSKFYVNNYIDEAFDYLALENDYYIYALTCFSDMNKILSRVEVL